MLKIILLCIEPLLHIVPLSCGVGGCCFYILIKNPYGVTAVDAWCRVSGSQDLNHTRTFKAFIMLIGSVFICMALIVWRVAKTEKQIMHLDRIFIGTVLTNC